MKYKSPPPPYESFLEEAFARHIKNYLKKEIILKEQHEVETLCGNFRFDFVIEHDSRIIAFEIDGQNYHNENTAIYDFWRDSVLLAENHAQTILRLAGPVLKQKMDDCIFLLSHIQPEIFNKESIHELKNQTNPLVQEQAFHHSSITTPRKNRFIKILYPGESEIAAAQSVESPWISLKSQSFKDDRHKRIYTFVKKNNGGRVNPLIYKYHKKYNNYGI